MKRALLLVLVAACGPQLSGVEPQPQEPQPQQPQPQQPQPQPPLTGLPCDVRDVLKSACAGCHAGAVYIPGFTTRDDLLSFGAMVGDRLRSTADPMPPRASPRQLSAAERELLSGWVLKGMPAGECGGLQ